MNTILWDYESVWPAVWPQNICSTLWLIFHGFCLISWKLFSGWKSYFGIMSQYDLTYDLHSPNICRLLWPIFHGPLNLPLILKTVWCMNIILSDYESVWHDIWPRHKCRSLWPIFHGPVILTYILNSIWWIMSSFWKMSQCNTTFDLKIN